jgi:thioredoxin 1
MAPWLDQVGTEYQGKVNLVRINADEHPELLRELGVLGIPTMLVYQQGQETARRVGAQDLTNLQSLFAAVAEGEAPPRPTLSSMQRMLRLAVAAALAVMGISSGNSVLLLALSGVVFFTAVYDRCPIWQAIAPRLKALLRQA